MRNSKSNRKGQRGKIKTVISSKLLIITATLVAGVLGFNGCADYASLGVGYSDAYYVPDYRPFYAEYFYNGVP